MSLTHYKLGTPAFFSKIVMFLSGGGVTSSERLNRQSGSDLSSHFSSLNELHLACESRSSRGTLVNRKTHTHTDTAGHTGRLHVRSSPLPTVALALRSSLPVFRLL